MVDIKIDWIYSKQKKIIYTGNLIQRLFKIGPKTILKPKNPKLEVAAIICIENSQLDLLYYGNNTTAEGITFDFNNSFSIKSNLYPLNTKYRLYFFVYTTETLEGIEKIVIKLFDNDYFLKDYNIKFKPEWIKSSGVYIGEFIFRDRFFVADNVPLKSYGITENVLEIVNKVVV